MRMYANREELEDKVDWEGGPAEFIFGYGFDPEELPDGTPDTVREAVARLRTQADADMETFKNWLYATEAENPSE